MVQSMSVKSMKFRILITLVCAGFLTFSWGVSHAQDYELNYAQNDLPVDIIPAQSVEGMPEAITDGDTTHPPVRITPDKSELIRLEQEAASIIVGNPAHLSVLAESSKVLVLIPRQPGATYVTVLDHKSNVIMQRHVIVASPKNKYVRIRRACASAGDSECQQTQVYYCPDMCHAIAPADLEAEAPSQDDAEGENSNGSGRDDGADDESDE